MSDYDLFMPNSGAQILKEYNFPNFPISNKFKDTFPKMTYLVENANITEVEINGLFRRIFVWKSVEGKKIGWNTDNYTTPLLENSETRLTPLITDLLDEHLLFLQNIGGIIEILNDCDEIKLLTCAKNFLFSLKYCFKLSHQEYKHYIGRNFEEVLNTNKLICFTEEENGAMTFYDNQNSNIYVVGIGYNYNDIQEVDFKGESNIYTIKEAKTFIDFVEKIATQWISIILCPNHS